MRLNLNICSQSRSKSSLHNKYVPCNIVSQNAENQALLFLDSRTHLIKGNRVIIKLHQARVKLHIFIVFTE